MPVNFTPEIEPTDAESQKIVHELRESVSHGIAFARYLATLSHGERSTLRRISKAFTDQRRATERARQTADATRSALINGTFAVGRRPVHGDPDA